MLIIIHVYEWVYFCFSFFIFFFLQPLITTNVDNVILIENMRLKGHYLFFFPGGDVTKDTMLNAFPTLHERVVKSDTSVLFVVAVDLSKVNMV